MKKIIYTISGTAPPFNVYIYKGDVLVNISNIVHNTAGTYSVQVPSDGSYRLDIRDAKGCMYSVPVEVSTSTPEPTVNAVYVGQASVGYMDKDSACNDNGEQYQPIYNETGVLTIGDIVYWSADGSLGTLSNGYYYYPDNMTVFRIANGVIAELNLHCELAGDGSGM